jgi:hypothetical protein
VARLNGTRELATRTRIQRSPLSDAVVAAWAAESFLEALLTRLSQADVQGTPSDADVAAAVARLLAGPGGRPLGGAAGAAGAARPDHGSARPEGGGQTGGAAHPSVLFPRRHHAAGPGDRWRISLGGYAPARGMSVFTVEPPINRNTGDYPTKLDKVSAADRKIEFQSYADAVRMVLLGAP